MLFDDTYKVIVSQGEGLYKEKGSKFIAQAFPVNSEDEAKARIAEVRKKYFDARHHCYAYIINPDKSASRSNDDGEPSGTAGKPILNQILSKDVTNTCVVVTRYFGGVLLGTSGLINAYKTAAREALDNAKVEERTVDEVYALRFAYPLMNDVMRVIKEENLRTITTRLEMDCYVEFAVRRNAADRVTGRFGQIFGVEVNFLKTL